MEQVIVGNTNFYRLKQNLKASAEQLRQNIIKTLAYIGEECVKMVRLDHEGNWNDRTGNLRSSIGYAVIVDGQPIPWVKDAFKRYPTDKGDGAEGEAQARRLIESLQGQFNKGIALVVVAGMDYAYFVEDKYHKVVLSQAKLQAERMAKQLLKSLLE